MRRFVELSLIFIMVTIGVSPLSSQGATDPICSRIAIPRKLKLTESSSANFHLIANYEQLLERATFKDWSEMVDFWKTHATSAIAVTDKFVADAVNNSENNFEIDENKYFYRGMVVHPKGLEELLTVGIEVSATHYGEIFAGTTPTQAMYYAFNGDQLEDRNTVIGVLMKLRKGNFKDRGEKSYTSKENIPIGDILSMYVFDKSTSKMKLFARLAK